MSGKDASTGDHPSAGKGSSAEETNVTNARMLDMRNGNARHVQSHREHPDQDLTLLHSRSTEDKTRVKES